jgi:hypothetical protein
MAVSGLVSLILTFSVIVWGARKLDDSEEITLGRNLEEHVLDLGTDIIIAVFISSCVAMLLIGISEELPSDEAIKAHINGPLKEHFKEPFKEIFIAGAVALVSFGTLLVLRASLLVQHQLRTNTTLQKAEKLLLELQVLERDAVVVTAEAGAGSALASLLKQNHLFEHELEQEREVPEPELRFHQATRAEKLRVLSAAGRCTEYWFAFALRKGAHITYGIKSLVPASASEPSLNGEQGSALTSRTDPIEDSEPFERTMIKLTAAKEFLRESASDIARSNRLAISNIRYVTSLVCSALITIGNLPNPKTPNGKKALSWRPVWLAITTYDPQLWFDDTGHFLENTGLTPGTVHLQYWGRYLRLLRYLMMEPRGEEPQKHADEGVALHQREQDEMNPKPAPVCIRVFGLREPNPDEAGAALKKFNDTQVFGSMFPLQGKISYLIPARHTIPSKTSFPQEIALALIADAADAITQAGSLKTRSGGQLEKWLQQVKEARPDLASTDLNPVAEVVAKWHDLHRSNISSFIRSSWEKMHAWELEYFSAVQRQGKIGAPRISNPRNTRRIIQAVNVGVDLSFIDGNPLEVFLDGLLLYSEAREADAFGAKGGCQALADRWHKPAAAHAYYVGQSEPEPGPSLLNERKVTDLLKVMIDDSDLHAFGLAPVDGDNVQWGEVKWLMAIKSQMSASLGMARVDFLDLDEQGRISLTEVQDPDGEPGPGSRIALSDIVKGLESRKESQDFERLK